MESNDQYQIANSYTELLEKLIRESGYESLQSWCIACITLTDIPNALYHAMYFHGQLKRYKQSNQAHLLKNPRDRRIPSELEIEKISFLDSLNDERLGLLDTPPLSISGLQELIDITKQELESSSGHQRAQINEKLKNLELIWQIQQCIQASKDKLQQLLMSEQLDAQPRLDQVIAEIQKLREQWLAGDNDDIKYEGMEDYIQGLKIDEVQYQSKPKKLKEITEKLNLITAIYNKIKERDYLLQIIGPKKSFSGDDLVSKIQQLEEKLNKAMKDEESENIQKVELYLKEKQEDEKNIDAKKSKKLKECQDKIKQLRQIISDEKQLQMLKRELKYRDLKYIDLDENTFDKVTQSRSQLARRELTMRQYLEMPNSLEYSLYKLTYFTEVLKSKAEDSIFNESDIKQSILQLISSIDTQYKDEAYPKQYNEKKDQLINLSQVRTNLDELNLEEIQKTATDLIASIKKFDFQEFFHLYSLVDESAKEIKDKDIVLLLGSTGSGKSTTTHYLCGSLLEKVVSEKNKLEHIQAVKIVCRDLQKVKISNASRSETRYITPIKVELDKIGSSQKKTVILVDSPGAEDTESYEVDIANMLGIIKAIHHAKTVRPIILVSFMKQGCRCEGMAGVLQFYCQMINNVQKNGDKFQFVFTKAEEEFTLKDLQALIVEVQDKYCGKIGYQEFDSFIDTLVLKAANAVNGIGPQQVRILKPLDKDYLMFHEDIQNSPPVTKPSEVFQKTVLPKAYESVDQQFRLNSQSIVQALKKKKCQLALYKFNQLIKYSSIFPNSESYERQLKNLIQEITIFLDRTFEVGTEKLRNVFEKGNKLTIEILQEFFKAYKEFQTLDYFVSKCREAVESGEIVYPVQGNLIKENWKTSNLFIINLIKYCSYGSFIDKYGAIGIDSQKWDEFISQLNLTNQQLNFLQKIGFHFDDHIQYISQQIFETEEAFKIKMEFLCIETQTIIETNIVLESQSSGSNQEKEDSVKLAIKRMKDVLEKIQTSQINCAQNEQLSQIIAQGIEKIQNCLILRFNQMLSQHLQELCELIYINKAQKEQNNMVNQNEIAGNNFGDYQLVNVSKVQADNVTSFLNIHGQVIEQLQFYLQPEYFQQIKMIGQQFQDDLFDIYNFNERKLSEVASNSKSKITNIKQANKQIQILRKIPFIEHKTSISYNQIINKINQLFSNQKQAIDEVLPELAKKMNNRDGRLIHVIQKLKDALKTILALKEISDECESTYKMIVEEVQRSIDAYIDQISDEISQSDFNISNIDGIKNLEPLFKQIVQIGDVAHEIGYQIKIEKEKVNKGHKKQLENLSNFFETFVQNQSSPKQENEESKEPLMKPRFLKRQECEFLQMNHLYLKSFKDSTYLLKYTGLIKDVQKQSQMLKDFVEEQIKRMILNIQESLTNIEKIEKDNSKNRFKEHEFEENQDRISDNVQFLIYEIQDRLRTLKYIEEQRYYGIKDFLEIIDQVEKVKYFVEDLFNKSFTIAQPKFDVKMIILRKLTILDSILYPKEKRISTKYSLFDRSSNSDPEEDKIRAFKDIQESKYNQVKDTLIELSDQTIINKIKHKLRQKEKEQIEKIQRMTSQMSEGFNEAELKQVNECVEQILLIQQSIPQKYLAYQNEYALNIIIEFYNKLIEIEEMNRKQDTFSQDLENLEQYYKMKVSRPRYLETAPIQQSRILSFCSEEKFKSKYEELQKVLLTIKNQKKDLRLTKISNNDPISKIIEELHDQNYCDFDQFPRFRMLLQKFEYLSTLDQDINSVDKMQAQIAIKSIQKMIDDLYKEQYDKMRDDIDYNRLREKDFDERIKKITKSFEFVSKETKLVQEQKFKIIFQTFEDNKMNSNEEFKKMLLDDNSNPIDIEFQKLLEKLQNQIFDIDVNLINQKCQKALQNGIDMFESNPCKLLKNYYHNLNSIKKIIHILSQKGETQNLINQLDQTIADKFEKVLQEIQKSCKQCLEINKKEDDKIEEGSLLSNLDQFYCYLEFKNMNEAMTKELISNLDQQMKQFIESLLKVMKNILETFEKSISDSNKMAKTCELIFFVDSKKQIFQIFQNKNFTRYVNQFQSKNNENITEFITIINKLKVPNLKKQVNELHLKPGNQQIIDLIEKLEKQTLSQEELDQVQYKFTILQDALSLKDQGYLEPTLNYEDLRTRFSKTWLQKVQAFENKTLNIISHLEQIQSFQNEYQFILNLSNTIKINKIGEFVTVERQQLQKQIDRCEESIKTKFNTFIINMSDKLKYFERRDQISDVTKELITLQKLRQVFNNSGDLNDQCKYLINGTLDKIQKMGDYAIKQIHKELKDNFPYGERIIDQSSIFDGMSNEKNNQKLLKKSFKEILMNTTSSIEKNKSKQQDENNVQKGFIEKSYSQFYDLYQKNVEQGIKSTQKNAEKFMKECKTELQGRLSINEKTKVGFNEQDQLTEILAYIFTIWTLGQSDAFYKADQSQDLIKRKQLLKYPHPAQVIAIYRILCTGYTNEPPKIVLSQQRLRQFKLINEKIFFNNVVEMQSSNGKSLVIGIASLIYALWGFEVHCCQRNEYLAEKNRKQINWIFQYFDVEAKIKYNTIKDLCQSHQNEEQEIIISEAYKQRIVNQKNGWLTKLVKKVWTKSEIENNSRRTILLFQDVQVLFDNQIYGKLFQPKIYLKNEDIGQLFDYIWKYQDKKFIINKGLISVTDNDVKEFKKFQEFFNSEYQPLMDEVLNQMIFDIKQFESANYKVEVAIKKIQFQSDFSNEYAPDKNFKNGYLTLWAYYKAMRRDQIDKETCIEKISLLIKCAKFSYNEILKSYGLIAGVTSGLTSLNKEEKHYLQEFLGINNFTVIPSMYDQSLLSWKENKENRIKIFDQQSHFYEIRKQIEESSRTQPVVVVFKDEKTLNEFEKTLISRYKINMLPKDANSDSKQALISKAGEHDKITLITQDFVCGLNIQCNSENGIHIIQTFFSQRKIQDLQIRNLTARHGNKGSYQMILNQNDLEVQFAFNPTKSPTLEKMHKYLKELRQQKQKQRDQFDLEIILRNEKLHGESMKHLKSIKENTCKKETSEYLQKLNKGPSVDSQVYRTLILVEASECMQEYNLNQELYNGFPELIEKLKEIHQKQVHQFKIGVYRNYHSMSESHIYQGMQKWATKAEDVQEFLRQVKYEGTSLLNKASTEVAMFEAYEEIKRLRDNKQSQIQQIIIIGKNEGHSEDDLLKLKSQISSFNYRYWRFTPAHEVRKDILREKIPISSLQVGEIKNAGDNFKWIAKPEEVMDQPSGVIEQLKEPSKVKILILSTIEEIKGRLKQ